MMGAQKESQREILRKKEASEIVMHDRLQKILIAALIVAILRTGAALVFAQSALDACYTVEYDCLPDGACYTGYGWYKKVCCDDVLQPSELCQWCWWEKVGCYCIK
jgi:hypothetical protein